MRIIATRGYQRAASRLLSPEARAAAEAEIAARPEAWPVIQGTGGARVIYFVLTATGVLFRIDIYAKNVKEALTGADKQEIRRRIETLAGEA